ncbi:MAG: helicase-related protein, partial [Acidobacteriota bacterium]
RRVAARAAARRIAEEQGWTLGREVGFHVRFDRTFDPDRTRVLVVTEGILVQQLQADPFLDGVGALVFDEFHERSIHSDLALAMARRVRAEVRDDLRLIVMSATLDAGPIADYLDAPTIASEGRLFPVAIDHENGPTVRDDRDTRRTLPGRVAAQVRRCLDDGAAGVLAFLPGVGEIRRTAAQLDGRVGARVLPLYGALKPAQQDAALRPLPGGERKIVLATNVAETSVTVAGIDAVVDSGLARQLRYDPAVGLDRLVLAPISAASATQRAGRAGRLGPGRCLRLGALSDARGRAARETPEIRRLDLAGPALQLLAWGEGDLDAFGWFERPEPARLDAARDLLRRLGALGPAGVTDDGQRMARLPLHPRLARLVLAGLDAGVRDDAARLAALLSERDVVRQSGDAAYDVDADPLDRLDACLRAVDGGYGECACGPVDRNRARDVLRVADHVVRASRRVTTRVSTGRSVETRIATDRTRGAKRVSVDHTVDETTDRADALCRALLRAYPDRVVRRRDDDATRGVMVGGKGVRLSPACGVRAAKCFVALELDGGRGPEAWVRQAARVARAWLDPALVVEEDVVVFDASRARAIGRRIMRYDDLVLDERDAPASPDAAAAVLAEAAIDAALEEWRQGAASRALPWDDRDVAAWLARLRSLAGWMPALDLPTFDDAASLRPVVEALCAGRRSFDDLRRAPLLDVLRGWLPRAQLLALDRHAPAR